MKTMKFVLLAALMLAGTGAFAQRNREENNRPKKEKQKTEVRSEHKESDTRQSRVAQDPRSRNKREIVYSEKGSVRYTEGNENRNAQHREYDPGRNEQRREQSNDRYDNRNNHHSNGYVAYRKYDNHNRDYAYDRRNRHDDACPLCYLPRFERGYSMNYSVSDLATVETNRISMVLDLSERQIYKIYRINLNYLSRRPGNHFYAMERRERAIRKVLRFGQIQAYEVYLDHLDNSEICDNCHDGWGNGTFRIAFQLNL